MESAALEGVSNAAVPGALLPIHGSATHTYKALADCAYICFVHADCAGFVDNRADFESPVCVFKASATHVPRKDKDLYIKQCEASSAADDFVRRNLSATPMPRVYAVDD